MLTRYYVVLTSAYWVPSKHQPLQLFKSFRVPTQIVFSNSLFFPCLTANFPCANLRHLWLLHAQNCFDRPIQLLEKKKKNSATNITLSFTFRIREFTTWANKISCVFPVFWQNFQIPCVFPDRDFFLPFSLFSLCRGYPEYRPHRGMKQQPPTLKADTLPTRPSSLVFPWMIH